MLIIRRVEGDSMYPALRQGQVILARQMRNYKTGQVIIVYLNGREIIKRISEIDNGRIFIEGDNKNASTDSNDYGWINDSKIEGIVFWPRGL